MSRLLGRVHHQVDLYGSGGFTTYSEAELAEQLAGRVTAAGIPRVTIKIGGSWGRRIDRDLERIAAVAAAHNLQVSAHCAPNLSAHIGVTTPNFRHIEWFADHDRIR